MEETYSKILLRIPDSHRRAFKILAAERDTSSTELFRQIIRKYLEENGYRDGGEG